MIEPISPQKNSFSKKLEAEYQGQLYVYRGMEMLKQQLSQLDLMIPDVTLLSHLNTLLSNLDLKIDLV